MIGCQAVIANFGGAAFSIVRINGVQWAVSVVVAALSLPWAMVVRTFPDPWFAAIARVVGKPFMLAYQPLSRAMNRLGRPLGRGLRRAGQKMRKGSKEEATPAESEASDEEKGASR